MQTRRGSADDRDDLACVTLRSPQLLPIWHAIIRWAWGGRKLSLQRLIVI